MLDETFGRSGQMCMQTRIVKISKAHRAAGLCLVVLPFSHTAESLPRVDESRLGAEWIPVQQ